MFIAVAGNMGSGKTETSQAISRGFGVEYLPRKRPELKYLDDLFSDPTRWSFETQVSFLGSKADNIRWGLGSGRGAVLDRSIYEDASVFAQYFFLQRNMDERAYRTYSQVANYLIATIPVPDLLVYCRCSPQICSKRLSGRHLRPFERVYPAGHLERISELYEEWIGGFSACPAFSLNTESYDIRQKETASKLLEDIETILREGAQENPHQLSLFDSNTYKDEDRPLNVLVRLNDIPVRPTADVSHITLRSGEAPNPGKVVYIAAPFSQQAVFNGSGADKQSFLSGYEPSHGVIPNGVYRRGLSRIATTFKNMGFIPHLPHRDVNQWGRKNLASVTVVQQCRAEVIRADLFFGIFGMSTGVHFEAGVAAALSKPILVARFKELDDSFFAHGIGDLPNSFIITADTISDMPGQLRSASVRNFLQRYGLVLETT